MNTERHLQKNKQTKKELNEHLVRINSPKVVFISEDGSGVVRRTVYDSNSNQLVGLVLPLQPTNGCPKTFSYIATSEEEIRKNMELPQSSL